MANEIVPGNQVTITTRIRNNDKTPTNLAGSTLHAYVYDAVQTLVLDHELAIDAGGLVTFSDGLSLVGTAAEGIVLHTITPAESTALLEGWYTWLLTMTDASGKTSKVDRGEFQVQPLGPGTVGQGVTLRQLIQDVASVGRDYMAGEVTTASGTLNTVIDSMRLIYDSEYFRGTELTFTSGKNEGVTRRVTGSDMMSGTLQITPNLPYQAEVGDTFDLVNFRGIGHTRNEYINAINSLIRRLGDNALEPVNLFLRSTISYDSPRQRVPEALTMVCAVEFLDYDGQWNRVKKAVRPDSAGWWIDLGSLEISFSPAWADLLVGKTVRITGMQEPKTMTSESDRTSVDAEWLIESAAGILQTGNPANAGNLAPGQWMANRADAVRVKAITIPGPNCVRIRS